MTAVPGSTGSLERVGWFAGGALVIASVVAGSSISKFAPEEPPSQIVHLAIVDELGRPIDNATVEFDDRQATTGSDGVAELELERPVVAVVSEDGYLDEPLAIDPTDDELTVRLWSRFDEQGRARTSVHFGGDVMLGRRYLDPERTTPFVDDEASARRVVAELAPIASTADATVVNLESVIGNQPADEALAAKRFVIQSTPFVTAALDELGVDLVTLGNNHAFDWGERGLTDTLDALDAAGIGHVGASNDPAEAIRGRIIDAGGHRVGIISATTVNGDYVNDNLPDSDEPRPPNIDPEDEWQYEERLFGLRAATSVDVGLADTQVASRPIRISDAWEIVDAAERWLSPSDADAVWQLTYSAFPELQDWVARRGHGGAARYQTRVVAEQIAELRANGADLVVVQIHGGFQFAPVASSFIRTASRAAIDAGADAVVSHHPHVLQGVEWHNGGLIVHSLGNLVFDQGFHATFPSAVLRVISDGEHILEARLLPLVIDRYRPTPLAGSAARDVVGTVAARSSLSATSTRIGPHIRTVIDDTLEAGVGANVRFDRNSGVIERGSASSSEQAVTWSAGSTARLAPCSLIRSDQLDSRVESGSELLWWGSFDRDTTDSHRSFPTGWLVPAEEDRWRAVKGVSGADHDLAVELITEPNATTSMRIAALIDVPDHRLFGADGAPIDDDASYEVRMQMRRERGATPVLRLTSYVRHDIDPTLAPYTQQIHSVELPVDVPADGEWHDLAVPVPSEVLETDTDKPTALNLALVLPPSHLGTVAVDEVELVEWRGRVATDQPIWIAADRIRQAGEGTSQPLSTDVHIRHC